MSSYNIKGIPSLNIDKIIEKDAEEEKEKYFGHLNNSVIKRNYKEFEEYEDHHK
jgi:hypothetical protein